MALNTAALLGGLPDMAATIPSAIHVRTLLALKEAGVRIPADFACWVLTYMPPSAALTGLGLMNASEAPHKSPNLAADAADLNGYIRGCTEQQNNGNTGSGASHIEVTNRIKSRLWCNGRVSVCWMDCAVAALIRTVRGGVNLAHLRPDGGDGQYLDLLDIEPDWSYAVQPSLTLQGIHQGEDHIMHAGFDLAAALGGYQPPVGQFQQAQARAQAPLHQDAGAGRYQPPVGGRQPQNPYVVGGIPVFDLSHLREPSLAGSAHHPGDAHQPAEEQPPRAHHQAMRSYSPGSDSIYSATPRLGAASSAGNPFSQHGTTPFDMPFSQQSPSLPSQSGDSDYGSATATACSPARSSLLSPYAAEAARFAPPPRSTTLSPLASSLQSLGMMSPATADGSSWPASGAAIPGPSRDEYGPYSPGPVPSLSPSGTTSTGSGTFSSPGTIPDHDGPSTLPDAPAQQGHPHHHAYNAGNAAQFITPGEPLSPMSRLFSDGDQTMDESGAGGGGGREHGVRRAIITGAGCFF